MVRTAVAAQMATPLTASRWTGTSRATALVRAILRAAAVLCNGGSFDSVCLRAAAVFRGCSGAHAQKVKKKTWNCHF